MSFDKPIDQEQSALQRHRAILLATFEYMEKRCSGSFVYDQYDPVTEYYQQQKIHTEEYYKQRRLDRMQQQLARLVEGLQSTVDLDFASYIKQRTGYEIDIFEDLRKRVDIIIAKNEIHSRQELNDIGTMLYFYHVTNTTGKQVKRLESLFTSYSQQANENSGQRTGEYSEVVSRVENGGIEEVTISISTGPKPKHYEEQGAVSPDGKRKLQIGQWSDGKHASTYVAVHFPTASGVVYGTSGIRPDIKAWWKDNATIVIEKQKGYEANAKHKQVRSFEDVITIEYIEH